MNEITTYLIFNGHFEEALNFYVDCLEGEIVLKQTFADAPMEVPPEAIDRIFNSHFAAGGIKFRASVSFPGQDIPVGRNFALFVTFSEIDELEKVFSNLSEGGNVIMPLSNTNTPGGKFGMIVDKFKIQWMLTGHL